MNDRLSRIRAVGVAGAMVALAGCTPVQITHVPPGQSLGVAMAKKPELVHLPGPPPGAPVATVTKPATSNDDGLPKSDNTARVAEAFSRGEFCMGAGNDDEAIAAFLDAVKIDPTFTEAWQRLAALYEKKGDNKKAMEAFRRSKKVASQ